MELRVGNVVRRIEQNNSIMNVGDFGVVEKIENNGVIIKDIGEWQMNNFLEVIHDITPGMKVKRIKSNCGIAKMGNIYTIKDIQVRRRYGNVDIKIKEDSGNFWYSFKNFEIVEEETKETKIIPKEDKIEMLKEKLKHFDTKEIDDKINTIKSDIQVAKRNIDRGIEKINRYYKDIKSFMAQIKVLEETKTGKDFENDIKALLNHPSVKNVEIDENNKIIEITTDYIDIYDEDGNRYAGNSYVIEFNYNYMSVKIYGLDEDYCRRSYWTGSDPHPHVDGDCGEPCLGNAGSMLCQAMNEMEIYASYIIIFNFLQQVNTEDVAGKYIENWDCIDEDGNIITNPHERETYICSRCSWSTRDEDDIWECEECGEWVCYDCSTYINDYGRVCDSCLNDNWTECAECGEYERKEDMIMVDDELYCQICIDNNFEKCDLCDDYVRTGKEQIVEGKKLCESCYEDETTTCDRCDEDILTDNIVEYDGGYYCNDCYQEKLEEEAEEAIEEELEDMEEVTNEY